MSKHSPIESDDRWFRGEQKALTFYVVDADDAPLDVSGFAMRWVLQRVGTATDALSKTTGDSEITVADGAGTNDAVTVVIEAADTADLTADVYHHALWRTDAGYEQLLAEGDAVLRAAAEGDTGS